MRQPVKLPPCGIFIGSGIYANTCADYITNSGRVHTVWVPQSDSPIDMLDRILEENQGNLAQYWGYNGGKSALTVSRYHALEDLGITPPEPDWENGKFLTAEDWPESKQYPERFGAGVFKFIKTAAEKGIYTAILYTQAAPQWSQRFGEAGEYYLGYDLGEIFSFRLHESQIEGLDPSQITLTFLADDLIDRVRRHVEERHTTGWGNVMATSANFYVDYEIAAGADIPVIEDFAFSDLNAASALSRGLYRQYGLPLWGTHLAHEHYSWIPYSHPHKFPLLRAAMYLKYMAGSKMIVNESGNWFLQATLATDSPMFDTPRVELERIGNNAPHLSAPYVEEARKSYCGINYHSPIARRYRRVISDFYDFVKANGTPEGQPESTIAIAKGNNDLSSHEYTPNGAIAGMYNLADRNPAWRHGAPERGWNIVKKIFFPRPPVLAPYLNRFLSGTPYGMVDIVSFVRDQITAGFLSDHYRALLFAGWNTASERQYDELCGYVEAGGTLFISIPHLSTNDTRDASNYTVDELVHGGDFSHLCGVRIKGRGRRYYWATAPDRKGELGFGLPRRFGILTTCMGDLEVLDPTAEALVVDDEGMEPVLLRRRCGKGSVYFLNSWSYPGAMDIDEGPGATIGSPGLIGMIYRHIARNARGHVWITDDREDAGPECQYIACSYFPQAGKICLLNIDFETPRRCFVHHFGVSDAVELQPGEFRTMETVRNA